MTRRRSTYGRGYATCLRQFLNHRKRLAEVLKSYEEMRGKSSLMTLFTEERAVELWMNAASDHLYDLVRPKRAITPAQWMAARMIQGRCLDIGHGFGLTGSPGASVAEAESLMSSVEALLGHLRDQGLSSRTLDECFVTDRLLGLAPESGRYQCPEDLQIPLT